ncbi:MAG: class I SAM-dependent methyltransferase [Aestuariivirga sp.]
MERLYQAPEFARLYDADNPWSADKDCCLNLAANARSVLDLGCGTGQLAAVLSKGRRVVGVEPAKAMLDQARRRPGADAVTWIEGDARDIKLGERFDLVVMTGHAFQCLLTDADQLAVCRTIAAHLETGGAFIFDSRNPASEEWRDWVPDKTLRRFAHPELGGVEAWNDVRFDPATAIATYDTFYRGAWGAEIKATSKIRFADKYEIANRVHAAGLRVDRWMGDWDESPWTENSPEIIPTGSSFA